MLGFSATALLVLGIPCPSQGEIRIEYLAHACFRIHSPEGARIVLDPYASRVWIGYDFPKDFEADAVLITHPHYDHDAGTSVGRPLPWPPEVPVFREPGSQAIRDVRITGIRGKHADPWGKEFGQRNTLWLLECAGIRIAHLGDNGPLSEENRRDLGRVDILMIPMDARGHILKEAEVEEIRRALRPRVVIPMHYRHPELEKIEGLPQDLGELDPCLAREENVRRLDSNVTAFAKETFPSEETVVVFRTSPLVAAPAGPQPR
jgi:L-ascorbate metabolism protein UlaG (beta-lactamase superfamily)